MTSVTTTDHQKTTILGTDMAHVHSTGFKTSTNPSMNTMTIGSTTTTPKRDMNKVIIPIIVVIILIFVIVAILAYWKWSKKSSGKGGFRQSRGQTGGERRSIDPRNSQGRAVPTDSRRPDGAARGITERRSNGPFRPNTNDSTAPISVISSALPGNVPRHSRPTQALPAPPIPSSHHSNASDIPFRLLHQINPQRQNHYISSNNEPNPYYYASSSDNQRAGSRRLEESYQEPSSVNMINHAYEGPADQEHPLLNLDNTDACYYASSPVTPSVAPTSATSPEETYQEPSTVNIRNDTYEGIDDQGQSSENLGNTDAYCYASSPVTPCVAPTSTASPEEIYQKPSTTNKADHAYEGTTDQMQSNTSLGNMLRFGLSMISRPLPHRPSSSNCNDGPSLPPRNSSRGSRQEPSASASLRQRKPAMVNENNNIALEACSLDCSVRQKVPKKDPSLHKRTRQADTPLYHTLEKDEQQHRGHEQDNLETPTPIRLKGVKQYPLYYCLENNNNDSCSDSGIIQFLKDVQVSTNNQDSPDVTDSSGMIDNVLYTPMPSKPRNTKLTN